MKNMKRIAQTTLMAAAMAVTVSTTRASWAYVPLELRLAGADLVVVGKIDRLTDNFKVGERMHDVGAITVQRMLKGPGNLKEAQVAWPGKARFALSTDIRYRVGQQGIWILTRDAKQPNVYRANYPTDYQAAANLPKILAALKKLSKMKWSPAKAGLQMAVLVEQRDMRGAKVRVGGKPVKALAQASVYLMARNATGKPVHVANYLRSATEAEVHRAGWKADPRQAVRCPTAQAATAGQVQLHRPSPRRNAADQPRPWPADDHPPGKIPSDTLLRQ
jgi:hypothetical protein